MSRPAPTAVSMPVNRPRPDALLQDRLNDFEPFAALRELERLHRDKPPLGEATRASDDPVRLHQTPSLGFAPRPLDRYVPPRDGKPAHLYGFHFGLFGPNGPLPLHLTEYALERSTNAKDGTLAAFADVFHHRMMSLFYRAWAQAQPTVQAERGERDRFRACIDALAGIGSNAMHARDALPDDARRHHLGMLGATSRHPEALCALLEHLCEVPVRIVEFVAEWMSLPGESHLQLGTSRSSASLGISSVVGARVRGVQQRLRICLGPLQRDEFQRFLPGGEALPALKAAMRQQLGDEIGWDLQLLLRADQVPQMQLGRGGRLGLDGWMGPRPPGIGAAGDVCLRPSG